MDFDLSSEQQMIVDTATEVGRKYGPHYWLEKDQQHAFPQECLPQAEGLTGTMVHGPRARAKSICFLFICSGEEQPQN